MTYSAEHVFCAYERFKKFESATFNLEFSGVHVIPFVCYTYNAWRVMSQLYVYIFQERKRTYFRIKLCASNISAYTFVCVLDLFNVYNYRFAHEDMLLVSVLLGITRFCILKYNEHPAK